MEESPLARAVRLARGEITPDDVPRVITAWSEAKARSLNGASPAERQPNPREEH